MPQLQPTIREILDAYSRRLSAMRAEIDAMQQDMDWWADLIDPSLCVGNGAASHSATHGSDSLLQ